MQRYIFSFTLPNLLEYFFIMDSLLLFLDAKKVIGFTQRAFPHVYLTEGMEPDSERPTDNPLLSILNDDALIRSIYLLAGEVVAR